LSSRGNSGLASFGCRPEVDIPCEIEMTSLDAYLDRQSIQRVDFVKVDVEGSELLVFRGGCRLLSRSDSPAILFEVNEETASKMGSSCPAVKKLLVDYGYGIYSYDGKRLTTISPDRSELPGDLFAFKPHHFELFPVLHEMEGDRG